MDEHEVLCLVRIQGLSRAEVAPLLGSAEQPVARRLNRGSVLLTERLPEYPPAPDG